MRRKKGMTLVEIMIVAGVVLLLSGVAIANLLRTRVIANEAAALSDLRVISTAAVSYRSVNPQYPSLLSDLHDPSSGNSYVDSLLSGGLKHGYAFALTGSANTFAATALPQAFGKTGNRSFYVDELGVVKYCSASGCDPSGGSVLE